MYSNEVEDHLLLPYINVAVVIYVESMKISTVLSLIQTALAKQNAWLIRFGS